MQNKITVEQFQELEKQYLKFKKDYPNIRFGQWFMNTFTNNISDIRLFYTENYHKARLIIWDDYVK